jgi:glycosyltransferase involved in cell wall biosynthesis
MFLFLSLAEGFGFPPLEAMQMGTPVVSSDRTALREVVADAGLLVDPDKPQEVAEALLRLQGDQALCADLIAKGYRNIRRFSWKTRTQEYWDELFQ